MPNTGSFCDAIILGKLNRETIVNRNKELFLDRPGGNLLYTAYGFALWGKTAGLVSRIGCDCPDEWLDDIAKNSLNTLGITKAPVNCDSRSYFLVDSKNEAVEGNPQKYFSDQNLPMPKVLLGYESNPKVIDNRKQGSEYTIRPENFPEAYLDSRYLALCPVDFLTHNMIPSFFRARTGGEVFIHASAEYTHSSFFFDFPSIVNGASMLLISEENAKRLFLGKLEDSWLIAETLASYGIEIVIITKKSGGYDTLDVLNKKKYHISSYPVNCIDPIGVDDAFFGGFLAGYLTSFDPLYASIIGSATASVKNEGSTPKFLLGVLKDLLKARVDHLKENVGCV
jgi:sugar/nucleoside kinase (ribokinase family)